MGATGGEAHAVPDGSVLRRRRRTLLLGAATAGVLALAMLGLSSAVKSPAQVAAATAAPPPSLLTAPVQRRVLSDTVVLRGTVVQERMILVEPATVFEAERMVVTAVRVKRGQQVKAGQILVEVSGRPVIAMPGPLPAYRDIRPGARGRDVTQLQAALRAMGYRVARESTFGPSTKAALSRLYESLGYPVPHTGTADEQAVGQAEIRVREAERALADARAAASGDGSVAPAGGTVGGGEPGAVGNPGAAVQSVGRAKELLDQARGELAALVARTGPMLPMGEVVFVPRFPAPVVTSTAVVGSPVEGSLLTLATGAVLAAGTLAGAEPQGVAVGLPVAVMTSTDGKTVAGRVTAVGDAAAAIVASGNRGDEQENASSNGSVAAGYAVAVTPTTPFGPELVGQSVRLSVEVASTRQPVLVVPVAAVSAAGDGTISVTVATGDAAPGTRRVPVVVGASGDGYVEVKPADDGDLSDGDLVVVGAP